MPAPMSAFAAICESIAGVDPGDLRAIDEFFLREFPTLDRVARETAFNWALSLDQEPSEDDRDALNALLDAIGARRHLRKDKHAVATAIADEDRQCA
jgi:hypothetical protein